MKFAIITHVVHKFQDGGILAYAPYVREMNIWGRHVDQVVLASPREKNGEKRAIDISYENKDIRYLKLYPFNFVTILSALRALVVMPINMIIIFMAMQKADHIHLRCPGNVGLLGCLVQILFPGKPKTAKYAGNWDPKSKQPLSYRLQKKILSNTFLTKKMSVLVYGEWENQSPNIKPFFTATYASEKLGTSVNRSWDSPTNFMFVGSLSKGKRPVYALQLIEELRNQNIPATIKFYGDGVERDTLEAYIAAHNLGTCASVLGNQESHIVEQAYKESDFLILPSKSEGWPKVVAEAMFWGCIPVVTKISCVPWMLDKGRRGVLIDHDLTSDVSKLQKLMGDQQRLKTISDEAVLWSRTYTLDYFEKEIKKLLA